MGVSSKGVASPVAGVFGEQSRAVEVSRAVVGGSSDWERSDRGCVKKFDRQAFEADVGDVEGRETASNGKYLCRPIQRTVKILLEIRKIVAYKKLTHPSHSQPGLAPSTYLLLCGRMVSRFGSHHDARLK